ncbi:MAG: NADH-quinone oxidoreductase subunit L [Candidatus Omnitrophica bacterium]|nr:NADH-quinone oxidoreductase subunit L [Candidatus Omnitrophota bacterium]
MYSLIIASPFIAFVLISLFLQRFRLLSALVATASLLVSFGLILKLFLAVLGHENAPAELTASWIALPGIDFQIGLLFDRLSILMGLLVSGVGSLIFIFSFGYMKGDPGFSRFFAFLSFFAAAMLGIVFATNFIQIFIFWELVGLASYLLIGFWFAKDAAADAGKKAFLVNRVGDFGFILGIIFLWYLSDPTTAGAHRTLNFAQLAAVIPGSLAAGTITASAILGAGLLIFCGIVGKSAQFPLHVWLPDAMEGPTPVSALIHAATMVAAGVYLLARVFFIFTLSHPLLEVVALIGGVTAFMAATMAVVEKDIKRILAYSTMSQLGFMVMAMGLSSPVAGMYHLLTHGFFKALLFLGAGAVIHAVHTQNIFDMGGLAKKMPVTAITFFIGTFALAGLFPTSGFFSKEEILTAAFDKSHFLFAVSLITVFLTSFYMGRLVTLAFFGTARNHHDVQEAPAVMTLPLIVLASFSLVGGYLHIPEHLVGSWPMEFFRNIDAAIIITFISSGVVIAGLLISFLMYRKNRTEDPLAKGLGPAYPLLTRKYFIDDLYNFYVLKIQQPFAALCEKANQLFVIKGLTNLTGEGLFLLGSLTRKALTGNVQTYTLYLAFQVLVILIIAAAFIGL